MARGPICNHCEEKLAPKQAFCGKCGHPTEFANHDERVLWDLGQWEASRRRTATADPVVNAKAADSAARTKQLFRSAREKANGTEAPRNGSNANGVAIPEPPRGSFLDRTRRQPEAPARPVAPPAPVRPAAAAAPVRQAPQATPARPAVQPARTGQAPVRPAASTPQRPSASPSPSRSPVAPTRPSPTARPVTSQRSPSLAPPRQVAIRSDERGRVAPGPTNGHRVAATAAPPAPPVERREYVRPKAPVRAPAEAPLVVVRQPAARVQAPVAAPAPAAPAKPSRAERKAAEERRREAERQMKLQQKEAERLREEQRKEEERRRQEEAKSQRKRERKHRRHSKRVNRRAAELELRDGERVGLSLEGWSRFRRATLVVTNYRVALITRVPPQARWIPLEEVDGIRHRWRGAHSLVVTSPIEVITFQKSKKQMLGSFQQLLESEVEEARRPGANAHHHADITQEWCELATEIWDSRARRIRLWIRRHPLITFATAVFSVTATVMLLSFFTSVFSPYR